MATREVEPEVIAGARHLSAHARAAGSDYLWIRQLDDGRGLFLMPIYGHGARLGIGDMEVMHELDDVWDYRAEDIDAAWRAVLGWDGTGEPEGWYRHPRTARRRPDGNAASETVRE
jgi:hypothetical protein